MAFYSHWQAAWRARRLTHRVNRRLFDAILARTSDAFSAKPLGGENHPTPRVINTDKHAAYPPAIAELKADGVLEENCTHRPVQYLNNVLELLNRIIGRSSAVSAPVSISVRSGELGARSPGYEAIHMIRKGQAYGSAVGAKVGLLHRFIVGMFGIEV